MRIALPTDWTLGLGLVLHSSPRAPGPRPTKQSKDGDDASEAHPGRTPEEARASFKAIYEAHFELVYRVARRAGVPEAHCEDAVQEIFLVLHRKLPEFEGRASLRTYIYAIARRVARDQREKRGHRALGEPLVEARLDDADAQDPEGALLRGEALRLAQTILAEMDASRREVFVLAELEGFTAREIGEALDMSPNTVSSQLRDARRDFAAAWKRHTLKEAYLRHG